MAGPAKFIPTKAVEYVLFPMCPFACVCGGVVVSWEAGVGGEERYWKSDV